MKNVHLQFGSHIEALAADWFLAHRSGSRLIAKNYRCKVGELDLIFEDPHRAPLTCELLSYEHFRGKQLSSESKQPEKLELVFVEVKARTVRSRYAGIDSITPKKRRCLTRAAVRYLQNYRGPAQSVRFDFLFFEKDGTWTYLPNCLI